MKLTLAILIILALYGCQTSPETRCQAAGLQVKHMELLEVGGTTQQVEVSCDSAKPLHK